MNDRTSDQSADLLETRNSLLSGMRESKSYSHRQSSQTNFFETYQPLLVVFFQRKGLQSQDADDLAQLLVMKLMKRLERRFDLGRDGKFRAYLFSAAHNVLKDFYKELKRSPINSGIELGNVSENELKQKIEDQVDIDLLVEAKRRVGRKVSERDWQVFVALTESNKSVEQIAEQFGLTRNATDNIKYRIIKKLKKEVDVLNTVGFEDSSK